MPLKTLCTPQVDSPGQSGSRRQQEGSNRGMRTSRHVLAQRRPIARHPSRLHDSQGMVVVNPSDTQKSATYHPPLTSDPGSSQGDVVADDIEGARRKVAYSGVGPHRTRNGRSKFDTRADQDGP